MLVDVKTLAAAIDPLDAPDPTVPAHLVGFGSIGPQLLDYLGCLSDMSAILVRGEARSDVLDIDASAAWSGPVANG